MVQSAASNRWLAEGLASSTMVAVSTCNPPCQILLDELLNLRLKALITGTTGVLFVPREPIQLMGNAAEQTMHRIVTYVRGAAMIDPSLEIPLDRSLLEAGVFDSFGIVELITYIETEFDLVIPEEDLTREKMGSIRKMADYVSQKKAA